MLGPPLGSNGYVNYCSIESAVQARNHFRGVNIMELFPEETKPDEAYKELQVTFTTAQQNCRRPRLNGSGAVQSGMGNTLMNTQGGRGGGGMSGGRGGGGGKGGKGGAGQPCRSIYVGSLPTGTEVRQLSELAGPYGEIESIKFLEFFAFVNFMEESDAMIFWQQGQQGNILLHGKPLMINWGKQPPPDARVRNAIAERGATRQIEVGPVNGDTRSDQVAQLVKPHGEVEAVRLVPERGFAVVTMVSLNDAVTAQQSLHNLKMGDNPPWSLTCNFHRGPLPGGGGGLPPGGGQPPPPPPPSSGPPPPPPMMNHQMMMGGGGPPPPPPGGPRF